MTTNSILGGLGVPLRASVEQRLLANKNADIRKSVAVAFDGDREEERDYWDYAAGLPDSWNAMSRAPANPLADAVREIADVAVELANKIAAFSPELRTDRGFLAIDLHTFMEADLRAFSANLKSPVATTEAKKARPRSMSTPSAQRTYMARALTWFMLESRGKPMARVVATTVQALLDLSADEDFGEKHVRDVTEDICRQFKKPRDGTRLRSRILGPT